MTDTTEVCSLVERYSPEPWDIRRCDMKKDPEGEWVRLSSLTAALDENDRMRAEMGSRRAYDVGIAVGKASRQAEVERLREAMQVLHDDLIDNADHELLVNVNESVWKQFRAALKGTDQ